MVQNTPLPDGWIWTTVGDIAENIQYGYTESASDEPIGPKFLRITDIQAGHVNWEKVPYCKIEDKDLNKYLLKSGDIVFARTGATTGKSFLITKCPKTIFASYLIRLRVLDKFSVKYFSLFLDSPLYWSQIIKVRKGSAQPGVNATLLAKLRIPIPPLPEQHRIVSKIEELFTQLDAGVLALQRARAGLKRYKASVLKTACEGRLVPQNPNDEPAEGLLGRLGKSPMIGEDLPSLPEGWCWVTVGDLAENIQYGYTESASDEPIGPKFLRITDLQNGLVNWQTVPYCRIEDKEIEKYFLTSGDIVFARTGATTGKSYLITDCPKAVFASYLIRLRLPDIFEKNYFSLFLDSPIYWLQIMSVRKGSAQPGVNATILATLRVPFPPLEEQRRIIGEVERRLSVMKVLDKVVSTSLLRAVRLRQAILKRAFEGQLVDKYPKDDMSEVLLE